MDESGDGGPKGEDPWTGEKRPHAGSGAGKGAGEREDPWTAPVKRSAQPPTDEETWAREALERLAREALKEQRRSRRWSIFFRISFLLYAVVFLILLLPERERLPAAGAEHTALVEITGIISADSEANADDIVAGLRQAFDHPATRGVVLRLNSPGGSPVQAARVYREIRRLKEKHPDVPVIAVADELCASAAYYIASAADEIYADGSSLVGSIGVRLDAFGFVETMKKLGVERRLFTAGEHKGFLDPFLPLDPEDAAHVESLLADTYRQFVEAVKAGRGERLSQEVDLFNGWVWTGRQAKELGLVDGLASVGEVAREVVGVERVVDFTRRESYLDRLARRLGGAVAERLASELFYLNGLR